LNFQKETQDLGFSDPPKKIGIISFTDPRKEVKFVKEREDFIKKTQNQIITFLEKNNFIVINPHLDIINQLDKKEIFGINKLEEIVLAKNHFIKEDICSLIIGCFTWNEPDLPLELAKKLDVPIALVTTTNSNWPGITALTSTGASFWQSSYNYYIKNHERFSFVPDSTKQQMIPWIAATCAIKHLQEGKILLWGGTPALHMEHLNDDIPLLKRFLINDIITEDQFILVKKAEEILEKSEFRIKNFLNWLKKNNCKIEYDNKMLDEGILEKQIAFYLAAKDIIKNYHQNKERIIGTSVKCQPELSVDYGVTPCLIPAFLPFPEDNEGKKPIIPTVCEGDIKGLLTSSLLFGLNHKIPPLFGDLKVLTEKYFIIANCGAASAFYAGNSNDPKNSLSRSIISAQCQGESGGAFGYHTPKTEDLATYARLIRIDSEYILQYGLGKIIDLTDTKEHAWGTTWPHTAVQLNVPMELFIKAIGSNHLSLTYGNYEKELDYIAKLLSITKMRFDNEISIEAFLDNY